MQPRLVDLRLNLCPCFGSATLNQVLWLVLRNVCQCGVKLEREQQAELSGNSLWFKALRGCKGDGRCGGSRGSLLARLRLDASLMCGHILPGQWSPMRFECETYAVLNFTGGVHQFTTTLFASVIAGVICRVKEHGWWAHPLLVHVTGACLCVSQQPVGYAISPTQPLVLCVGAGTTLCSYLTACSDMRSALLTSSCICWCLLDGVFLACVEFIWTQDPEVLKSSQSQKSHHHHYHHHHHDDDHHHHWLKPLGSSSSTLVDTLFAV